jgi:hypothetical protein
MNTTVLRDSKGLFVSVEGRKYRGTWPGPGFEAGVVVEVKVRANQHGKHVRVMWHGCVGGDDKPGVVWVA